MTQTMPANPKTIGDHIRRRRLALHIFQKDLAHRLGVNVETLKNWERNACAPMVQHFSRIIEFLGYNPEPVPEALHH
jgi:DNA-binding transcriptional regulator YiaG